MFRASSCPSSGATTTAVTAFGLPSELGDSSLLVVVGPALVDSVESMMMHGFANPKFHLHCLFFITLHQSTFFREIFTEIL
jgi:hypothetical protein